MNTLSMPSNQCPENQFPVLLLINGRVIGKKVLELTKFNAGRFILYSLYLVFPLIFLVAFISLWFSNIQMKQLSKKIRRNGVTKESYEIHYNYYLALQKSISRIEKDGKLNLPKISNWFLNRLYIQISIFYNILCEDHEFLKNNLFEKNDNLDLPQEDVNYLLNQMKNMDHDWDDDELWKDFQIAHNHLN